MAPALTPWASNQPWAASGSLCLPSPLQPFSCLLLPRHVGCEHLHPCLATTPSKTFKQAEANMSAAEAESLQIILSDEATFNSVVDQVWWTR